MASDDDDGFPQTPVISRRVIKLSRKKKNNNTDSNTDNTNKSSLSLNNDVNSAPIKSPRFKSLNISKILSTIKKPVDYNGYSTHSSFNNSSIMNNTTNRNSNHDNDNRSWKPESLFDDEDLFPSFKKGVENSEKLTKNQKKKPSNKKKVEVQNDEVIDSNNHLKHSLETPIDPIPKKRRGRPPKNQIQEEKKKSNSNSNKQLKKGKLQVNKDFKDKKSITRKKVLNSNKKGKKEENISSSFSLFDVLDLDDNDQNGNSENDNDNGNGSDQNDEIFLLESPVKKRKRRKPGVKDADAVNKGGNDEYLQKSGERERKRLEHEDLKRQRDEENKKNLEYIKQNSKEEKERRKRQLEKSKHLERIEREREIEKIREDQRKKQSEISKKKKRMQMLKKLKESTSTLINSNVETIMIPLKDVRDNNNKDNNNNKNNLSRRSSLASRGRRLSSIGNGFVATPHDDIPNSELHKHIDLSLPDSHKLKQLIVWMGKRLIKEDQNKNNNDQIQDDETKEIKDLILNEFITDLIQGKVNVDWWGSNSEEINNSININASDRPIVVRKNKENIENLKKLRFYENEVKKLEREEKIWNELKMKVGNGDINNNVGSNSILNEITSRDPIHIEKDDYDIEDNSRIENSVHISERRTDKLERLVHRLDVSNQVIQRVMENKNKLIAQSMKEKSTVDALGIMELWTRQT